MSGLGFGGVPLSLVWELLALDKASPVFKRVGASATAAAAATETAMARYTTAMRRTQVVGATLTRKLTLPLAIIGGLSVKAASDFSASMTKIQTQAGGSAKDVKLLSAQVLALSDHTEQGPNELADALFHLKSVGLDNVGAMKALKQASDLAAVGGANLEDTTNALAGAWRTGIRGAKDFHQAVATLNAIIGAGNMHLEDLTAALGTGILPTAKTFGLTLKDVGSALAVFTDEAVPADAAATRLRMTFSLLGAPSAAAEKQLEKIGLTGLKLANDMRKPDGLITAIGDLKDHLEDPQFKLSLSEQAQLLSHAFGGGRSSSAILSLVNNFDVLQKKQEQVTASMQKFNHAVETQRATPEAKFKLLEASLQHAAIILGNQLLPIVTSIVQKITSVGNWFSHQSSGMKKFIVDAGLVLLAIGPVLSIIGRIGLAFGRLASLALAAGRGLRFVGSRASSAAGGIKNLSLVAGVGVAAVVLLAKAWMDYSAQQQRAKARVQELTDAIRQDSGAIGVNTRAVVANQLEQYGTLKLAQRLGISLKLVTDAALGNAHAQNTLRAQLDRMSVSLKISGSEAAQLGIYTLGTAHDVDTAAAAANRYSQALGKIPKSKSTRITLLGTSEVQSQLGSILTTMTRVGQGATAVINVTTRNTVTNTVHTVKAQAAGTRAVFGSSTIPPNTSFTVGERGWEGGVTDSMGRASIFSHAQAKMMGFRAPRGYAKGTGFNLGGAKTDSQDQHDALHRLQSALFHFAAQIRKTGSDVKNVFGEALAAVKQLGASKDAQHRLTVLDNKLAHKVDVRNRDMDRLHAVLGKRHQLAMNVRGATVGGFDLTSSGTGFNGEKTPTFGLVFAQATQEKNIIRKWAAGLRKLAKVFGRSTVGKGMLRKLAEAGPASYPQVQALASASAGQLSRLVGVERSITETGVSVGTFVGGQVYGSQVHAAQRQVQQDRHQAERLFHMLDHRLKSLEHSFQVTVKVGDRQIARAVAEGNRKNQRRGAGR